MENASPLPVIIATPVGVLSNSLRTFLQTIAGLQVVARVTTQAGALSALGSDRRQLLLLDADLAGQGMVQVEMLAILVRLAHRACPSLYSIVLINDPVQKQAVMEAGASQAILKGTPDEELRQAIQPFLAEIQ
jgi:DNA-binding NarL/FixJ family response regulator